ncbi:MAG TPA: biotin carboxylase N-terminal domain-containing protein, partial [Caulobacteraceae bacterium]|nr:biotin carboxylase N-terminal domain-containing protein [Caulobacteraceae bacterium]
MFKRVLIANRGEIAIRIARAADALGVESVSVFAAADALGLHTRVTTETREIGARGDPVKAYLDIEALIAIAKTTGCDCVHPGYGFLSENAAFAHRCAEEGLAFIGPRPETLALFGDKVRAKALAKATGVPTVPGAAALASADAAMAVAEELGYPVMLKAAAGGGGRGMRRVDAAGEMAAAFGSAAREAEAAFGDGAVFLEKLIQRPRHIEVQILADTAGTVVHLFERDCSVQLRHQKVIEIAPAPNLDPALRQQILGDAVSLAMAANYVGAGTVEFLVDPARGERYFIECNPRIQVEHTVTEVVTGIDLVEAQFRIAAGETLADVGLGLQAAVPTPRGFAVQTRVTATGVGTIAAYKEPSGPGVRVDACGYLGLSPPPQFDPMFAKVIGASNSSGSLASALERTSRALAEFQIAGLPTNLGSLQAILARPELAAGDARTTLLADHPELTAPAQAATSTAATLLAAQAATINGGAPTSIIQTLTAGPSLDVRDGDAGVECPMAGSVVEVTAKAGATVAAGDTLMIVSAMKMETAVTAPCAGVVAELASVEIGGSVGAGQIVATITPTTGASTGPRAYGEDSWAPTLEAVTTLQN